MKHCLTIALTMLMAVAATAADNNANKKAPEKLQGIWDVVGIEAAGRAAPENYIKGKQFVVKGNKISLPGKDPRPFKIDAAAKPTAIDITGSDNFQSLKGIYELKGDSLKLCFSQSTKAKRPKDFATAGSPHFCYTLKRHKP